MADKDVKISDITKEFAGKSEGLGFKAISFDPEKVKKDLTEKTKQVEEFQTKMSEIEELVLPILSGLAETADKEFIHWPNRKKLLEDKIKRLIELTR